MEYDRSYHISAFNLRYCSFITISIFVNKHKGSLSHPILKTTIYISIFTCMWF